MFEKYPEKGISYQSLSKLLAGSNLRIEVKILSLSRAAYVLTKTKWCATGLPFGAKNPQVVAYPVTEKTNKIKLYRLRQSTPFNWKTQQQENTSTVGGLYSRKNSYVYRKLTAMGYRLKPTFTPKQNLQLLLRGKVDFITSLPASIKYYMKLFNRDLSAVQASEDNIETYFPQIYLNTACPSAASAHAFIKAKGDRPIKTDK